MSDEKKLSLEEQYKLDKERRLNNTIKILKEVANETMTGAEKKKFLEDMGEEDSPEDSNN